VNPDLFITIAFVSLVLVLAFAALVVVGRQWRREADADDRRLAQGA
jgi:hypothetical protein